MSGCLRGYHWAKWVLHETPNQGFTRLWLDRKRVRRAIDQVQESVPGEELQLLIEKWAESIISKQGSNPTVPP